MGNKIISRTVLRIITAYTIVAISLTVMGMVNVSKDAFGSHGNFGNMHADDFRTGDIVHGTITETLGYAATMDQTYPDSDSTKYTEYYFLVPYYDSQDSSVPDRIIIYKTGNTEQFDLLEKLKYETIYWYVGDYSSTTTHVYVDRAEITGMSSQEYDACINYIDNYLEVCYKSLSEDKLMELKNAYYNAIVPVVVQYKYDFGATMLTVGLVLIGILVIGIIIFVAASRGSHPSSKHVIYISSRPPEGDPNLNSPTGLKNAASDPYFSNNNGNFIPKQTTSFAGSLNSAPTQTGSFRTDYSNSQRPMPPIETNTDIKKMPREMNFDPYTGKPLDKTIPSPSVNSRNINVIKNDEGMPSVDPNNLEQVDLSNGGIDPDAWENRKNNAEMPMNGNIPVINPESHNSAAMFGSIIPSEPETHTAPEHEAVTPIHPSSSSENMNLDIQVEQTDPEMRNVYAHMAGGEMHAVDPYTEKNVDISNGGIELPETEEFPDIRRSFPDTQHPASLTEAASFPQTAAFPETKPSAETFKASDTVKNTEPPKSDSYNIFKSDSSYPPYIRDYSGGNSYNIFKTDDKINTGIKDLPSDAPSFPEEKKDFPKLDTSFPSAGESDIGGKDDFIF